MIKTHWRAFSVFVCLQFLLCWPAQAWRSRCLDRYQNLAILAEYEAESIGEQRQVKDDPYASGGKCLVIGKTDKGLRLSFKAKAGVTAVWIYGRVPSGTVDKPWPPLYLNIRGEYDGGKVFESRLLTPYQPVYMVVNAVYLPVHTAGTCTLTIRGDAESTADLWIDRIELRDELSNCEAGAFKQGTYLYDAEMIATLRTRHQTKQEKEKKGKNPATASDSPIDTREAIQAYADSVWQRMPKLNTMLNGTSQGAINALIAEASRFSQNFLETGDAMSARRAGVLLVALAERAPTFNSRFHAESNLHGTVCYQRFGMASGHPYGPTKLPTAYDKVFDHLKQDKLLAASLSDRVISITTPQTLCAFLDRNILQYELDLLFRFSYMRRLLGWEKWVANAILCLGPNRKGQEFMDLFMTLTYGDLRANGGITDYMINAINRDGVNFDNASHYNRSMPYTIARNAMTFKRFVDLGGNVPAQLYDPDVNPRLVGSSFFVFNYRSAGGFQNVTGDGGDSTTHQFDRFPGNRADNHPDACVWLYQQSHDPRFAWLATQTRTQPINADDALWNAITNIAAKVQNPILHGTTTCLPGYGRINLEFGEAENDPTLKASAHIQFGTGRAHQHGDLLDLTLNAFNQRVIPDGGRAGWPWMRFTAQHNSIEVDRTSFQSTGVNSGAYGYPLGFGGHGILRYASAGGWGSSHPTLSDYRRDIAFIDLGVHEEDGKRIRQSYVFSVNHISGGSVHTYCTHGMRGELTLNTEAKSTTHDPLGLMYKSETPRTGVTVDPLICQWNATSGLNRKTGEVKPFDFGLRQHIFGWGGKTFYSARGTHHVYNNRIPFLWIEREADAPISDSYASVYEPTWKTPALTTVKTRSVTGGSVGADTPRAVEVINRYGRTDTVIISKAGVAITVEGGITTDAHIAMVSRDQDGLVQASMIGGSYLKVGDVELMSDEPVWKGSISALDQRTGKITLDPAPPVDAVDGDLITFNSLPHMTGEYIEKRKDGLYLKRMVETFRSPIVAVDSERNAVIPKIAMPLTVADPKFYEGCTATNEKHDKFWRVKRAEVAEMWMPILTPVTEAMITDVDGDGKRTVSLTGFAPPEKTRDPVIWFYGPFEKPVRMRQYNREPFVEPVVLEVTRVDSEKRRIYFVPPTDYDLVWNCWVYDGVILTNEADNRQWRGYIPAREFRLVLDGPVQDSDFTDALSPMDTVKDGERRIHLYHFGVGDPFMKENEVTLSRGADGTMTLTADATASAKNGKETY